MLLLVLLQLFEVEIVVIVISVIGIVVDVVNVVRVIFLGDCGYLDFGCRLFWFVVVIAVVFVLL